jgi:2,4-dienoyl-CoA reductase-like NADH-dependent reductase (Old Yellow Enzyme family)
VGVDPEKLRATAPSHLGEDPLFPFFKREYEALDEEKIADIVVAFGQGARRTRDAAS